MNLRSNARLLLGVAILFTSCKKPTPTEVPPVSVTVTPVIAQDVTATNEWVGLMDGYKNANIQAQVTGYLLTQNYKEGSRVKQGEVLFTIDPRPFEAALAQSQATYASAVARAQLQQITLQRQTQLFQTKVISEQEYQTSYQDTQASLANVAACQAAVQSAQVNLGYCTILAPFDGVVGIANAQIGDLVGPGGRTSLLTQASQLDPMKLNFFITEAEYLNAAPLLQKLQNTLTNDNAAKLKLKLANGQDYPELGKFEFYNREVNASTGTIQITALFANPNGTLRPGLFALVTAPVAEIKNALLIPQKSKVEMQGNFYVGLLQPDNTVKAVPVKLGPTQGQMQVVFGPLKAGDQVVVDGIEKARPGVKVVAKPYVEPTPAASNAQSQSVAPTTEATPAPTATPAAPETK
jgi:membrane fusion protein (multidrug efflux system)